MYAGWRILRIEIKAAKVEKQATVSQLTQKNVLVSQNTESH